jgi:hypothetical protein
VASNENCCTNTETFTTPNAVRDTDTRCTGTPPAHQLRSSGFSVRNPSTTGSGTRPTTTSPDVEISSESTLSTNTNHPAAGYSAASASGTGIASAQNGNEYAIAPPRSHGVSRTRFGSDEIRSHTLIFS